MENTKVSAIIPAYNAELFIEDAIESVMAQNFNNIEIIIVDDGSTDKTAKIVQAFDNIHLIRQSNLGAAAARNAGLKIATGDYIAYLDADDLWLPEKTRLQIEFLQKNKFEWCYCDSFFSWFVDHERIGKLSETQGIYSGDILLPYLYGKFSIPLPATMIRKEIFEEIGGFDSNLKTEEHTDLWARIAIRYPIGFINIPLAEIRKRFDSLKQVVDPQITGENRRIMINKVVNLAPEKLRKNEKSLVANAYSIEGKHFLRFGRLSEAQRAYFNAIKLKPLSIKFYFFWIASFFKPIPYLFYKTKWRLYRHNRANLSPSVWIKEK